jgi:protein TonB
VGDERPTLPDTTIGDKARDSLTAEPVQPTPTTDSVYSVLEVDTAVARMASSAAPAYPLKLLEAHVMGFVQAQYVVDTTGFADTTSFHVITATNPEFVDAVRQALPYMRFHPAKIGSSKVRQLVEQQFSFRIADTVVAAPVAKGKKPSP